MKTAHSLELLKDFAHCVILPGVSALLVVGVILLARKVLKYSELTHVDVLMYAFIAIHLMEARIRRDLSERRKDNGNANS